jgi:hypothetical protein
MGRSSVEATKACRMRAVLARRAALVVRLTGFLALLAVVLAVFEVFLPDGAGFVVFCTGFFAVEEAEPAGAAAAPEFADPLADCAATGSAIISQDNKTAKQREASRGAGAGEFIKLITSLYAAFGQM